LFLWRAICLLLARFNLGYGSQWPGSSSVTQIGSSVCLTARPNLKPAKFGPSGLIVMELYTLGFFSQNPDIFANVTYSHIFGSYCFIKPHPYQNEVKLTCGFHFYFKRLHKVLLNDFNT
jgi:hypothetical protein